VIMLRQLFLILSVLVFAGCTHSIHLVHVSDFSPTFKKYSEGQLIKARAEQFVVMGFATETNYVDEAYNKLIASCTEGSIQGITTEYLTSHGFFSWTNSVEMQGLCVK
jgi:hypothetical protein